LRSFTRAAAQLAEHPGHHGGLVENFALVQRSDLAQVFDQAFGDLVPQTRHLWQVCRQRRRIARHARQQFQHRPAHGCRNDARSVDVVRRHRASAPQSPTGDERRQRPGAFA
jgi:hypothetical protein